jgi:hypothetical protein
MSTSTSNAFPLNIQLHFKKFIDFKSVNQIHSQFLLSKHNALLNININDDETLLSSSILTEDSVLKIHYLSSNTNSSNYSDIQKIVDTMK